MGAVGREGQRESGASPNWYRAASAGGAEAQPCRPSSTNAPAVLLAVANAHLRPVPRAVHHATRTIRHRCQALNRLARAPPRTTASMITDRDLFSLAIFLGAASMILIVVYHFLEVNAVPEAAAAKKAN